MNVLTLHSRLSLKTMPPRRLGWLSLLLLLAIISELSLQAQITTKGKEFWLSGIVINATSNGRRISNRFRIYAVSEDTAQVRFVFGGGSFLEKTLLPNEMQFIDITASELPQTDGLDNKGIKVESDQEISVYAMNFGLSSGSINNLGSGTGESSIILPKRGLGKVYLVLGLQHGETGTSDPRTATGTFVVVATADHTLVEIVPSQNTLGGELAGDTILVEMDAGDTYLVRAENDGDLTGSSVRSLSNAQGTCANIAVFTGTPMTTTNIEGNGISIRDGNYLYEQLYPLHTWGKDYLYVPFHGNKSFEGDMLKILAAKDQTTVQVSGEPEVLLNAGEVLRLEKLSGVRSIKANKPISVAQFSLYHLFFEQATARNAPAPFQVLLTPIDQGIPSVSFNTLIPQTTRMATDSFILITAKADQTDGVFLDDREVNFKFFGDYAYTTLPLRAGDHHIRSPKGVNAYVYAFPNQGVGSEFLTPSIGFSIGSALENLNLEILANDEFLGPVGEENLVCKGAEVAFEAKFDTFPGEEPRFNTFQWDFGDGNFADGRLVTHRFTEADTFLVTLTASDGLGGCSTEEVQTRQVIVADTEVDEITGPLSVCPGVEGVAYSVSGAEGNTYQWLVSGGSLVGDGTGEQVLVNWGQSNPDAAVKVVPFNELGCRGDTLVLPVVIDLALQPALPQQADGQPFVCFNDRQDVEYFTPFTPGSVYQWFVEGGQIIGAGDGHRVRVQWQVTGVGKVWYREFNPNISDCEGVSDTLSVELLPPIELEAQVVPVACFGEQNGAIVLDLLNRDTSQVNVAWEHGPQGLALSGLAAGDYTARITDALGCERVQTFRVPEPPLLAIDDVGVLDVRCFQESNGSAAVVVRGGTAPYQFVWQGPNGLVRNTSVPFLEGLSPGDYSVQVVDANQCATQADFVIDSPALLEADLESLINHPVCPEASDGTAFIDAKGGTPDYQFFWSNQPDLNSQTATGLSKGTYTVRIVDANGCQTSSDIEVTEFVPRVVLPNAFSPNGDGINDLFMPVADCELQFAMQIVNRWGNLVFSSEDIDTGWDGTFEGEPAETGAYTYVVFYSGVINDVRFEETFRGTVTLFR